MNEFNKYRPFRYWCHIVLPQIYDDSLSYFELLCKVIAYLNDIGETSNQLIDAFTELKEWCENYLESQNFQQLVSDKLDSMVTDGTLESLINDKILANKVDKTEFDSEMVRIDQELNATNQNIRDVVAQFLNAPKVGGVVSFVQKFIRSYIDPGKDGSYPTSTCVTQSGCVTPNGYLFAKVAGNDNNFLNLVEVNRSGVFQRSISPDYGGHCNDMCYVPETNQIIIAGTNSSGTYEFYVFNYDDLSYVRTSTVISSARICYYDGFLYSESGGILYKMNTALGLESQVQMKNFVTANSQGMFIKDNFIYLLSFNGFMIYTLDGSYYGSMRYAAYTHDGISVNEVECADYDEQTKEFIAFISLHDTITGADKTGTSKTYGASGTLIATFNPITCDTDGYWGSVSAPAYFTAFVSNNSVTKDAIYQDGQSTHPFNCLSMLNFMYYNPKTLQLNINAIQPAGDILYNFSGNINVAAFNVDNPVNFIKCTLIGANDLPVTFSGNGSLCLNSSQVIAPYTITAKGTSDGYRLLFTGGSNGRANGGSFKCWGSSDSVITGNMPIYGSGRVGKGSRFTGSFGNGKNLPFTDIFSGTSPNSCLLVFIDTQTTGHNFMCYCTSNATMRNPLENKVVHFVSGSGETLARITDGMEEGVTYNTLTVI